jgi:hypothetical protein
MMVSGQVMRLARCRCGCVELEAMGTPIASIVCYCDDCQEGSRRLEALPGAQPIRDAAGGTGYVLFRKDRIRYAKGQELLSGHKLIPSSASNRVTATCCNAAMALTFDDIRHWVPVYRARFGDAAPALQWRICTRFKPAGAEIPADVPGFAMYPLGLMARLLLSGIGTLLRR